MSKKRVNMKKFSNKIYAISLASHTRDIELCCWVLRTLYDHPEGLCYQPLVEGYENSLKKKGHELPHHILMAVLGRLISFGYIMQNDPGAYRLTPDVWLHLAHSREVR
jgi:hypothetical protein